MIKKAKAKILASVQSRKINVFLLFLVLAFAILLLTKLSKDYTKTITFNIEKTNIPEEHVILNDSTNVLDITIKTYGFKLLKYYLSNPKFKINFSEDVDKNDSTYVWNRNKSYASLNAQFNKQVEIISISQDNLFFKYDVNTVKKVPVKLNIDVDFSPGYDLAENYILKPDSIRVIGPNSIANKIVSIETENLSISKLKSNINRTIKLVLPENSEELKFSVSSVNLSATVERFTEGTLRVPIFIKNVPEGFALKYFPKSVNITYYTSLNTFNTITVNDFKVECDYSKISSDNPFLIPEITEKPKNIKNEKISQQRIEFIIAE